MRTFSLLKGLSVFDRHSGNILGEVSDLCITNDGKIKGLIMDGKGLFKRDRMIPLKNVFSFGRDGIMIDSQLELLPVKNMKVTRYFHTHQGLHGKPLLTAEGEKLGLFEDVYFQEELGTIIGYEVTDGFFADITEGKKVIKTCEPLTIGKDVIVVNVKM